jgi:hypothetical protein
MFSFQENTDSHSGTMFFYRSEAEVQKKYGQNALRAFIGRPAAARVGPLHSDEGPRIF